VKSGPFVTVRELAATANRWCLKHGIAPANGQAGERITERNIRYYRARGILDAPGTGAGEKRRGFSEKHAGQLRALRLLQARGLPLEEISQQLRGRSLEELRQLEEEELRRHRCGDPPPPIGAGPAQENWLVTAVGAEYLLISRRGRILSEAQRAQIAETLGVAP
jgi:DNA-binding transcriptional MerR regulator